jgi:hypothetical protein
MPGVSGGERESEMGGSDHGWLAFALPTWGRRRRGGGVRLSGEGLSSGLIGREMFDRLVRNGRSGSHCLFSISTGG